MIDTKPFDAHVNDRVDVVVAGGGVTGQALATALASGMGRVARIALLSRDGQNITRAADSRCVALGAASVRMLTQLGVWDACAPLSQPVSGIDISDSSLRAGVRPILLSYDNLLGGSEAASHIVPLTALEQSLSAAVAATPQIIQLRHTAGISFEVRGESIEIPVTSSQTLRAKLLVAADGRRSPLRAFANIKTTGWSYAQTGITVTVAHDRPHGGRAVQHFLPGGPFALLPLPGNRTCVTWSESEGEARRVMALDDAAFLDELELRAGGRLGALQLDGPRQAWPLGAFVARSFIAPRFALAGDAAHNVHPIAGQGLNLGLRDCAALAECAVDAQRLGLDIGQVAVLQRYERWRRFDTLSAAASFDALNRLFSDDGQVRRSLREFGLGLVNRLPGLKQRLVVEAAGLSGDLPRLMRGDAI